MMPETEYVIEVQHSSDHEEDGIWTEIDKVFGKKEATGRLGTIGFGYIGRPVRVRVVNV